MVEGGVYENPWLHEGKHFTSDDIDDFFGFVYCITISRMGDNTSDVSTFGSLELLKAKNVSKI